MLIFYILTKEENYFQFAFMVNLKVTFPTVRLVYSVNSAKAAAAGLVPECSKTKQESPHHCEQVWVKKLVNECHLI